MGIGIPLICLIRCIKVVFNFPLSTPVLSLPKDAFRQGT